MKRKISKKLKPAAARKKPPAKETPAPDIDALVGAAATVLGLRLDPAWQANVKFNLQLILHHAALVDEFPLADDAEPAPVFRA
jgi:Protein of unknown function (DUF4089)